MTTNLTFRSLESETRQQVHPSPGSWLDDWYESVRDTPIRDLKIGDLCRACRQNLCPEHVVSIAIERLAADITAGDKYDGELLRALVSIDQMLWFDHRGLRRSVLQILDAIDRKCVDGEIRDSEMELRKRVWRGHLASLERLSLVLLDELRDTLTTEQDQEVRDFVDSNKFGEALDDLCAIINTSDYTITTKSLELIRTLEAEMRFPIGKYTSSLAHRVRDSGR